MNGPNKTMCYISLGQKGSPVTSAIAYSEHLQVTKKIKCGEYTPKAVCFNISLELYFIYIPMLLSKPSDYIYGNCSAPFTLKKI
jgi:hypothetical protein